MTRSRTRPTAHDPVAQVLEMQDEFMREVLADLVENAAVVNRAWRQAVKTIRTNREYALEKLTEAEVLLDHHLRIELSDARRAVHKITAEESREEG
jgi:hypothetical protein